MSFDPEQFKNAEFDVGEGLSTEIIPPDEGVYSATIYNWNVAGGTSQKGNDWVRLDITYSLDDPDGSQKEKTGREYITARQGVFLDLTDGGALDFSKGRNIQLGQVLNATDLNGGQFTFAMLEGKPVQVLVRHRETENGTMAEVRKVAHQAENIS